MEARRYSCPEEDVTRRKFDGKESFILVLEGGGNVGKSGDSADVVRPSSLALLINGE